MNEYKGVWILAEQNNGRVQRISHELLARGRELAAKRSTELVALIFGARIEPADLDELIERGADRVVAVEAAGLEHFLIEPYARCMRWVIDKHRPEIILAGATSTGRTLMPYVAIQADAGLTADCTVLDIEEGTGNLLQTRPAIGGNILATIKTPRHRPQMATVRPRSTKPAPRIAGRQAAAAQVSHLTPPADLLGSRVRRCDFVKNAAEHGLQEADVVVAVGRGIKKGENLKVVAPLVKALDAALGALRDAVDRGWLSYPHQIGLSGKTVTPKLYVGLGVSGSIQHLAGMQTSENIVAVNSDPDAQIFRVADIGIIGNLFEVVPVLAEKIQEGQVLNMTDEQAIIPVGNIERSILLIRGQRVILSPDLAKLYGVEVRALIQAVKRNQGRFPDDFFFQLSKEESGNLKSHFVISSWGGARRANPYAFTEHGAIMAATVLNSEQAVKVSVYVVRTFVKLREMLSAHKELAQKLAELENKLQKHDRQIIGLIEAIRELMTPPPELPRKPIGFATEQDGPKLMAKKRIRHEI